MTIDGTDCVDFSTSLPSNGIIQAVFINADRGSLRSTYEPRVFSNSARGCRSLNNPTSLQRVLRGARARGRAA